MVVDGCVGALVLLALAFLTPLFYFIPDAALAAVIIMAVTDMIDFSMVKHIWTIDRMNITLILIFLYSLTFIFCFFLFLSFFPLRRTDS